MGNVQASSIANQLLPFESYINDVPELKFSHSLGSTRFMKVARAEHAEGSVVIKVFVLVDQSFSIEPYREQVLQIRKRLLKHPNCSPFTRVYTTNRCAILCRTFAKYTLYDRLSTRPFLLDIEKKWIAFQLLKALSQCRIAMVFHGDLKSENVLVSSSLWVQLSDFASFKPSFLPYDNPSTFTFFFDTSRRRCCNLAPERFKKSDEITNSPRFPGDFLNISDGLTEAMDIFAMGCVIVELLTDGRQIAFTLPQAIDYKRMDEHNTKKYLKKILCDVPKDFHPLLTIMLDRDPVRRREEYLKLLPCNSELFPSFFEDYLYQYLKEFCLPMAPDDVITKMYIERNNYLSQLKAINNAECVQLFVNFVTSNLRACRSLLSKMDGISLLQIFAKMLPSIIGDRIIPYLAYLVTDFFPQVRAEAIFVLSEILSAFEPIVQEDCRLLIDFIFPKLKLVTIDTSNHVKSALAANIGNLAIISLRLLDEGIRKLHEEDGEMLCAYVSNNNLDNEQQQKQQKTDLEENEKLLIKSEREALETVVNELFVNLCGSDNEVRQSLFEPVNLELLCHFFGTNGATDILMHMITVLNDKPDWRMRATFYESCPVVAKHLGQNRCGKLLPFLQQGLQDCQEYVVYANLCCVYSLCDQQLLPKSFVCEIMRDIVPFLVHPNKWLRVAVVNILVVLQSTFNVSDFYCKITPLVRNYLTESLIVLNDRQVVYESLDSPIPRIIWDFVVGYQFTGDLLVALENRRTLDKLGGGRNSLFSATSLSTSTIFPALSTSCVTTERKRGECFEITTDNSLTMLASGVASGENQTSLEAAVRKLSNLGLDESIEDKVLAFKNILPKMNGFEYAGSNKQHNTEFENIHLSDFKKVRRRIYDMENGTHRIGNSNVNFRDLFGASTNVLMSASSATQPLNIKMPSLSTTHVRNCSEEINSSDNLIQYRSSSRFFLEETLNHKREQYFEQKRITAASHNSEISKRIAAAVSDKSIGGLTTTKNNDDVGNEVNPFIICDSFMKNSPLSSYSGALPANNNDSVGASNNAGENSRRIEIKLLSHIHEHAGKISRLALHPDKNHFASCSADKTIKLWSTSALLDNSHPAALSSDTLRYSHKINACSFLSTSGYLAIASEDGELQVFDVQHKRLLKVHRLDLSEEGAITELHSYGHVIYALTQQSHVYCFDLRIMPKNSRTGVLLNPIWKREPKNSCGLLTSFCIDNANQHWMFLSGSSATSKNLLLWDLRFNGLEVTSWAHTSDQVIPLKCWSLARGSQCSEVFTNSTREGEVSLWDLSTQSRTDLLWPSELRPIVYVNDLVTSALTASCIDPNIIYTGDSEGSLRCWNLKRVDCSNYLSGPYRKYLLPSSEAVPAAAAANTNLQESQTMLYRIRYNSIKFRDNLLRVQAEERLKFESKPKKDSPMLLQVSDYHHDSITDLLSMWPDLLVSSGNDGVIKLWKSY